MARRWFLVLLFLGLLAVIFLGAVHNEVHRYDERIVNEPVRLNLTEWPRPRVAVVFGASVFGNGELSPVLEDRVDTAIELYRARQIDRILVSGDNRHPSYNEPKAMYDYLVSHAVDKKDVIVDYAGRSTYETCLRAKSVFGLQRAVLVTQNFHLSRALYLANELGLDAIGVPGDIKLKNEVGYQGLREWAAEVKAYFEVHVSPPQAMAGDRIEIR
jgi:SanA protein